MDYLAFVFIVGGFFLTRYQPLAVLGWLLMVGSIGLCIPATKRLKASELNGLLLLGIAFGTIGILATKGRFLPHGLLLFAYGLVPWAYHRAVRRKDERR